MDKYCINCGTQLNSWDNILCIICEGKGDNNGDKEGIEEQHPHNECENAG